MDLSIRHTSIEHPEYQPMPPSLPPGWPIVPEASPGTERRVLVLRAARGGKGEGVCWGGTLGTMTNAVVAQGILLTEAFIAGFH